MSLPFAEPSEVAKKYGRAKFHSTCPLFPDPCAATDDAQRQSIATIIADLIVFSFRSLDVLDRDYPDKFIDRQ
jgi:hypothetical protein